jgi:hypothetical protein
VAGYLKALKLLILRHRTLASFTAAAIVYFLFALFYMGGAITNCSESLLNFPGDNTAGMIALFSVDSADPWYGRSDFFSYPYGEALGQPTHITAQAVFVPFWVLAKLFGPICSFNILQLTGFMSAALVMFGFVRWLLKGREVIALIAGYGVAFTPYLQITSGGHISYVFQAVFIAAIWLFALFWKNPTWRKILPLGVIVALFAYIDGYFILLGGLLIAALIAGAVIFDFWKAGKAVTAELKRRLKLLGLGALIAIGCMLPVLYVQVSSAGQINELLADTRDSIQLEAQVYGARPSEYLLPNAMSPLTSGIFGTFAERDTHGSNTSESILSLSLMLIALATFFVVRVVLAARRKQKQVMLGMRLSPAFVVAVIGMVFLLALIFSFPPKFGPVPLPSYFLIEAVQLWRVLARLSVIVNIALVILAACGLALLLDKVKSRPRRILVCLLVLVVVFLEYLTFVPPRPVGSYKQVPELYYWLKTQQHYKEIAEYPLDELGASHNPVFYNTYQRVHGKKMLNGMVSEEKPYFARRALWDLKDPQAVPGLRALGIDFITVHSAAYPGDIPGLRLVHESNEQKLKTNGKANKVWGYAVEPGNKADYLVATTEGFHAPLKDSVITQTQVMGHQGVLALMKVNESASDIAKQQVTLQAKSIAKGAQKIRITQQGKEIWSGSIPKNTAKLTFDVDPRYDVVITAVDPTTDATLQIPMMTVSSN